MRGLRQRFHLSWESKSMPRRIPGNVAGSPAEQHFHGPAPRRGNVACFLATFVQFANDGIATLRRQFYKNPTSRAVLPPLHQRFPKRVRRPAVPPRSLERVAKGNPRVSSFRLPGGFRPRNEGRIFPVTAKRHASVAALAGQSAGEQTARRAR